jgi:hypothetical protein
MLDRRRRERGNHEQALQEVRQEVVRDEEAHQDALPARAVDVGEDVRHEEVPGQGSNVSKKPPKQFTAEFSANFIAGYSWVRHALDKVQAAFIQGGTKR